MSKAVGAQHETDYVVESVFGTTPATPAMTPIRHTGFTLGLTRSAIQSAELRADRQITDLRLGNRSVAGDVSCEFSYGTFDDFLAASLGGTWATGVPIAGTDQLKVGELLPSYTLRRWFSDINVFEVFTGVRFSGMSMSIQPDAIATVTFSCIGKDKANSDISGATKNSATTNSPLTGHEIGTIKEGGVTYAGMTGIDLSLDNGIEAAFELGSSSSGDHTVSQSNVTGTVTAYFTSAALLDKFINETESSLEFTLTDVDGNAVRVLLPRIKFTGGQPDVGGAGAVLLSMPFQALYDTVTGTNLLIERTPV
jgi:hypothetical protein